MAPASSSSLSKKEPSLFSTLGCWVDHGSNQVVHDWANQKKLFQAGKRGMEGGSEEAFAAF
ncbi:unnamed protein product, partial [Ilex paraguariensis]